MMRWRYLRLAAVFLAASAGVGGCKGSPPNQRASKTACGDAYAPICARDGKVYDNACAARAAGQELSVTGGCKALIPGYAACGAQYCDAQTSYCEIYLSDVPELPTDHFCRPLPNACKPVDGVAKHCDCFAADTPCLSFCGPLLTGGIDAFHLTCQGKKPPYGTAPKTD